MKKLLALSLAAAMLLAAGTVSAQEKTAPAPKDKGWWVGGQIGYWYDAGENTYEIAPEPGYDFNSRWAVGASVGFAGLDDVIVFELAPYARWKYYTTGRLTLFLDGGLSVACGDMTGFRIGFQPGLSIRINDRFRFLAHAGFLGYCNEFYNGGWGDGFGLKFTSSDLKFGFYYTF